MNNNMIKVLAVVVIAGGLWWWMSSGDDDPVVDACAAHADSDTCTAVAECQWNEAKTDDPATADVDETAEAGCSTKE